MGGKGSLQLFNLCDYFYINSKQTKRLIKGRGKGMQGAMGNTYNKILVGNRFFFILKIILFLLDQHLWGD